MPGSGGPGRALAVRSTPAATIAAAGAAIVAFAPDTADGLDGRQQFGGDGGNRNLVTDEFLDLRQAEDVFFAGERDGVARGAGARGAADAMHVVLGILRQVVVEHVRDLGDVQAAGGDVGRHQHRQVSLGEVCEQFHPLGLRHVARQHRRLEAVGLERGGDVLGHVLGVDEYQAA